MTETDFEVLAETALRDRAVAAVDEFTRAHGHPASRAQIKGLRLIAANEPGELPKFADKQRTRAEKREAGARGERKELLAAEVAFWKLVGDLCIGRRKEGWSLLLQRDADLPGELHVEKPAPGAKQSKEEQAAHKESKERRAAWEADWDRHACPAFFQVFCAHYLYRMPPERR